MHPVAVQATSWRYATDNEVLAEIKRKQVPALDALANVPVAGVGVDALDFVNRVVSFELAFAGIGVRVWAKTGALHSVAAREVSLRSLGRAQGNQGPEGCKKTDHETHLP